MLYAVADIAATPIDEPPRYRRYATYDITLEIRYATASARGGLLRHYAVDARRCCHTPLALPPHYDSRCRYGHYAATLLPTLLILHYAACRQRYGHCRHGHCIEYSY